MPRILGQTDMPEEHIAIIRKMRREEATLSDIAAAIGRTTSAVSHFIRAHGSKYGIERQRRLKSGPNSEFNKQWRGPVPLGHWMITKPWGRVSC